MATWRVQASAPASGDPNSVNTLTVPLDNASPPGDFTPGGVTALTVFLELEGSGFSDDQWGADAFRILDGGTTMGSGDPGIPNAVRNGTASYGPAAVTLAAAGTPSNLAVDLTFNRSMGNDGGLVSLLATAYVDVEYSSVTEVTGSGTSTSDGAAVVDVERQISVAETSVSSGQSEELKESLQNLGETSASDGAVTGYATRFVDVDETSQSSGAADAGKIILVEVSLSETSVSDGVAVVDAEEARLVVGVGGSNSSGVATIALRDIPVAGSDGSVSSGQARVGQTKEVALAGASVSQGTAVVDTSIFQGSQLAAYVPGWTVGNLKRWNSVQAVWAGQRIRRWNGTEWEDMP